jgi:hypothetical protein
LAPEREVLAGTLTGMAARAVRRMVENSLPCNRKSAFIRFMHPDSAEVRWFWRSKYLGLLAENTDPPATNS